MLDQLSVENLVRQQIAVEVAAKIESVIGDAQWLSDMESKIVQHVQDRITARFASIETVPDLICSVKDRVEELLDQGRIPGISEYVDSESVRQAVDQGIESFVVSVIDNLSLDPIWLDKIQNLVDQRSTDRVLQRLSDIDLQEVFGKAIDHSLDRVKQELQKDFSSQGIKDLATQQQFTVGDDQVTSAVRFSAPSMAVTGALVTHDLVVRGSINTDNQSWNELVDKIATAAFANTSQAWKDALVEEVLDLARTKNIDFKSVSIKGRPLINDNCLSETITRSSLNKVGALEDLTVNGHTNLNHTLDVSRMRVGINTETPDMALSIWDEEIQLSLGKLSKHQAFIGTSRPSTLSIGVNRRSALDIDQDNLVTVHNLRVQKHRISFAPEVPGVAGTRGDIVFNSDPKPNTAFAWVCLGSFKWQALRSS